MKLSYIAVDAKKVRLTLISLALVIALLVSAITIQSLAEPSQKYIKWVSFNASYSAMKTALKFDIESKGKISWIMLLSVAAAKSGGSFSDGSVKTITETADKINNGTKPDEITSKLKYFNYYFEAYTSILGGFVGDYTIECYDENAQNKKSIKECYGLKVFSPVASGYGYSHSDDFGNSRSYGYNRKHLGHDMMGSIGTPIIAVEDGIIENLGWNQYGGWRIGIRSLDFKRYYYYAHLRKGHPFVEKLKEGMEVKAGDVIGYLGMTGYSNTEDHNGMSVPHLHFGIQLIFDDSQIEGYNQIWIDPYNIIRLLENYRSKVSKNQQTNEYERVYNFIK